MRKKLLCRMLGVALGISLIAGGCGAGGQDTGNDTPDTENVGNEEDPVDEGGSEESAGGEIYDGYYWEDSTGLKSFYRFNEDGTYYAKFFDGGVTDAGTYEILDEEMEYSAGPGADGDIEAEDDNEMATAPQVIAVTSYLSGETLKLPFADDTICDISLGGMSHHKTLKHDAEYAYVASVEEIPIIIQEFYLGGSFGSMLTLNHDRTFGDATGDAYLNGTWDMAGDGVYDLTYADGSTATLTVLEGGTDAVLAMGDGTEIELSNSTGDNVTVLSMVAESAEVGLPMTVGLRLDCYSDNTCELIVSVAEVGAELVADTGTYSISDTMAFTFTFENAGEIAGEPDYASATESSIDVNTQYTGDVTVDFNGSQTPLSIDSILTGTYHVE